MIMSYLTKIEMSSFGDVIMLFCEGGHDDRRGHDYGTSGRIEAFTRYPEGFGEGYQARRGGRDPFVEWQADSKDREADKE
jgi:hypothetical protein